MNIDSNIDSKTLFSPFTLVNLTRSIDLNALQPDTSLGSQISLNSSQFNLSNNQAAKCFIQSNDLCGQNLFVGTNNGLLIHYLILYDSETQDYTLKLEQKKYLGLGKKPIDSILAVPTEGKLIILCDFTLYFVHMEDFEFLNSTDAPIIKGVTHFCSDKVINSPARFSVGKRRMLQNWSLSETLHLEKEISITDGVVTMKRFQFQILFSDFQQNYCILNSSNSKILKLLNFDKNLIPKPLILSINKSEFLFVINTQKDGKNTGLGMFINDNGDPVRGTLNWETIPKSVAYHYPYILSLLNDNFIQIHSIFTQQLLQTIKIPDPDTQPMYFGESLFFFESTIKLEADKASESFIKITLCCKNAVLGLRLNSLETQVEEMFNLGLIKEAVKFHDDINFDKETVNEIEDKKLKLKNFKIYLKAAIKLLELNLFQESLSYFKKFNLDPLIYIKLFKDDIEFINFQTLENKIEKKKLEDVNFKEFNYDFFNTTIDTIVTIHIEKKNLKKTTRNELKNRLFCEARDSLLEYLLYCRSNNFSLDGLEEIDICILQLYCKTSQSKQLYAFLLTSGHNFSGDIEACELYLMKQKRYYALSLLYKSQNLTEKLLELWKRMATEELIDPDFSGLLEIVEFLKKLDDFNLVCKFSKFIINLDPILGSKIFTERTQEFDINEVLKFFESINEDSLIPFLEYIIEVKGIMDEEKHTQLAILYLKELMSVAKRKDFINMALVYKKESKNFTFLKFLKTRLKNFSILTDETEKSHQILVRRLKLVNFLYNPTSNFDVHLINKRLEDFLSLEKVAIFKKLKEHEKVLEILVKDIGDDLGCEEYILNLNCSKDTTVLNDMKNLESAIMFNDEKFDFQFSKVNEKFCFQTTLYMRRNLLKYLIRLYLRPEYGYEPVYFLN
ncbi:hypothetical protein HK099_007059 [Clydaea vesicula]|uniref:CNH domain-containing protein n=1 Tax=Clydaea vesicula TaxID=447962 RepID=A0AAD5TXJ7_9FUNG|nr:hypothetical protein HK099_007059 [Clydaea vesicula]